mmetsp:Transcript_16672/g.31912  ORF Transcript_16672/g.31912 Transcript_16672/m.31912 type:complete len:149 (+) Transcript_16672:665-1111(+)
MNAHDSVKTQRQLTAAKFCGMQPSRSDAPQITIQAHFSPEVYLAQLPMSALGGFDLGGDIGSDALLDPLRLRRLVILFIGFMPLKNPPFFFPGGCVSESPPITLRRSIPSLCSSMLVRQVTLSLLSSEFRMEEEEGATPPLAFSPGNC